MTSPETNVIARRIKSRFISYVVRKDPIPTTRLAEPMFCGMGSKSVFSQVVFAFKGLERGYDESKYT